MPSVSNSLFMLLSNPEAVNRAFSKQATHFDEDDLASTVLQELRKQVYKHVDKFLPSKGGRILELNAGTGIDAVRFVRAGHSVHATDLSDGMVAELEKKKLQAGMDQLTVQQISFEHLENVNGNQFDLVFSNFGGLNCAKDLSVIGARLPDVLRPEGFITWVIMPTVSLWELATFLKGNRHAFRRWKRAGTLAHVEGEHFPTWYHTLSSIKEALPAFELVKAEGLASLSPPPYKSQFPVEHPGIYKFLRRMDLAVGTFFPFNRWADHIIVTMQLRRGK